MASYNIERLRADVDSGRPIDEIIDQLKMIGSEIELPNGDVYNLGLALEKGDKRGDIIENFYQGRMIDPDRGAIGAFGTGINNMLANVPGSVVDVMDWAVDNVVYRPIDYGLDALGVPENREEAESLIGKVGGATREYFKNEMNTPAKGGSKWNRDAINTIFMNDLMTSDSKLDLPPSERKWMTGGEVIGGTIPVVKAQSLAAKTGKELKGPVSKFFEPLVSHFRKTPKKAFFSELGLASGAAQGGILAYAAAPENFLVQLTGELLGTVLTPTSAVTRLGGGVADGVVRLFNNFTNEGQAIQAAKDLKKTFAKLGYEPEQYMSLLGKEPIVDGLTTAQQTKFEGFILLENTLKKGTDSNIYAKNVSDQGEAGLTALRSMMKELVGSGDPMGLKMAAELQKEYFERVIGLDIKKHTDQLRSSLGPLKGADAGKASAEYTKAISDAMQSLKTMEDGWWDNASMLYKNEAPSSQATADAIKMAESQFMTKFGQQPLPDWLITAKNMLDDRVKVGTDDGLDQTEAALRESWNVPSGDGSVPEMITIEDLIKLKRNLQSLSREAKFEGKSDLARIYNDVVDGVLKDLSRIDDPKIKDATDFSRTIQDTVYKTSTGDLIRKVGQDGRLLFRPESNLDTLTSGTDINRSLNIDESKEVIELANTAKPADQLTTSQNENLFVNPNVGNELTIDPALNDYFNALVEKKFIRTSDGQNFDELDANGLATWIRDNGDLINKIPGLGKRLEGAKGDYLKQKDILANLEKRKDDIVGEGYLGQILKTDDPATAIQRMLNSPTPLRSLDGVFDMVAKHSATLTEQGIDINAGLQRNIFDAVRKNSSSGTDGVFDVQKVNLQFTTPVVEGGETLIDMMISKGVMTPDQADNFKLLLDESVKLTQVIKRNFELDEQPTGVVSTLYNLMNRVVGATAGGMSALGNVAGTPLVLAQAGSTAAQKTLDKVPRAKTLEVLRQASLNPEIMKDLLEKGGTPEAVLARGRRLEAWLIGTGLAEGIEEFDETERMLFENEMTPE